MKRAWTVQCPLVSVWHCPVIGEWICTTTTWLLSQWQCYYWRFTVYSALHYHITYSHFCIIFNLNLCSVLHYLVKAITLLLNQLNNHLVYHPKILRRAWCNWLHNFNTISFFVMVITFYSPSCFGQETAKRPFGLLSQAVTCQPVYHTVMF